MAGIIWDSLDEESARLLRAALDDDDVEDMTQAQLIEIEQRADELTNEIKSLSSPAETLIFGRELTAYLAVARERKAQAQELQTTIALKLAEIDESEFEIAQLSAGRPALARAVNDTADHHEKARDAYGKNEFRLASLENLISMRRGEIVSLRRKLAELSKGKED
jgi:chromosome segregation ATPase